MKWHVLEHIEGFKLALFYYQVITPWVLVGLILTSWSLLYTGYLDWDSFRELLVKRAKG